MKNIFKVLIILVLSLMVFTGCNDGNDEEVKKDSFDEIKKRGYAVMGLDDTFAPMGFRDESGELVGFDVELAKATFEEMGIELKFQPIDWAMKETELNSGNIDMIWNGYSITDERKEKVAFTNPYIGNRQVIITLSDLEINVKEDLAQKRIAAQTGSSAVVAMEEFKEVVESFDGSEAITFDTNNEAFMDLESGRVDAVVADEILSRYYIKERGEAKFNVSDDNFGDENYGIGVRKEDKEFLSELNSNLEKIKKSDKGEEISVKWFGENILK